MCANGTIFPTPKIAKPRPHNDLSIFGPPQNSKIVIAHFVRSPIGWMFEGGHPDRRPRSGRSGGIYICLEFSASCLEFFPCSTTVEGVFHVIPAKAGIQNCTAHARVALRCHSREGGNPFSYPAGIEPVRLDPDLLFALFIGFVKFQIPWVGLILTF
jgi:hypothetical protein